MKRICVLVVTYNRLEKLKRSLKSYELQIISPYRIIVVDNNSTDGTRQYLEKWKNDKTNNIVKEIILLNENIGGSGGFHEGMKAALKNDFDFLWISDDDAYPNNNAFEILNAYIDEYPKYDCFCSAVIANNGLDIGHRKKNSKINIIGKPAPINYYNEDHFDINIFSFVGTCISRKAVRACGLPVKNFFIWYDDTEYSLRVNNKFKIMCIPKIIVKHDVNIDDGSTLTWKAYFGERNKLYIYKMHRNAQMFFLYSVKFKLSMFKNYFVNHKLYLIQRDGYRDFKKNIMGITEEHRPGK